MIANQMVGGGKEKDRVDNDFYPTPPSMTRHLMEREKFIGNCCDPFAGDGSIGLVVKKYNDIFMYDIEPKHEYVMKKDFFSFKGENLFDNIISNTPYKNEVPYILGSLKLARRKVVLLYPIAYLHGLERFNEIYSLKKLETIYIFVRRPALNRPLDSKGKYETGMQSYMFMVFNNEFNGDPVTKWINNQDDCISNKFHVKHSDQLQMEME